MKGLSLVLALLFYQVGYAYDVTDDHGVKVGFSEPPQRIISILPSITESVCILGKCSQLVGVDRYSDWPKSIATLPKLGGGLDPNIEAIMALKPDLVLVGSSPRASERLRGLGIKVFSIDAKSYADVKRMLEKLSAILGVSKSEAQKIWSDINLGVDKVAKSLPVSKPKARVYFEVNRAPYAAGPSSFIGETLQRLGLENIITPAQGPFPKINPEFVVRSNPDVIMVGDKNYAGMADRPAWGEINAIKFGNVCIFKQEDADVIVRPGPRIAEGAAVIAQCLDSLRNNQNSARSFK